jgi:hypothetical protein
MCVIGSVNLAAAGQTAAQILNRYFPGLDIGTLGGPIVTTSAPLRDPVTVAGRAAPATATRTIPANGALALALPDDDEGERDGLARIVLRVRDDIAKDLGVPAPSRLTIRFHPTIKSYEQATGQPWFTSGALVGEDVAPGCTAGARRPRARSAPTARASDGGRLASRSAAVGARRRGGLLCRPASAS